MKEDKYYLYGEKCDQIAFILGLENYKIVKKISKKDKKIIICTDIKNVKKNLTKNKLKHKKNYLTLNDIYKIINKKMYKSVEWSNNRHYINKKNILYIVNILRPKIKNIDKINKIKTQFLKPSEMLIKVLNSKQRNIECSNLEKNCNIDSEGYMWGCCPGWVTVPFGNILNKEDEYNSYRSRIIKLSSLNRTYCFCDFNECKYNHKEYIKGENKKLKINDYPEELTISIDRSCNLKCNSCRKCFYNASKKEKIKIEKITKKIIDTEWLNKSIIVTAGQGEVFFSKYYKELISSIIKRKTIKILTNGTLLNKKNWELLEKNYENIYISISIDATTKETYQKIRCGNFDYLLKNLKMLGELRKDGKIKNLQFNFVVQKDNYKEMREFIKMANDLNVDEIQFTKLNNWGTFTESEYKEKSMIIEKNILNYDLYKELKMPVFKDKKINMESFKEYMKRSDEYYNKRQN